MRASVNDVLAIPAVRNARPRVLGGEQFLVQPVRWLHTTDGTDLSGLLKGGEMILTAGDSFTATVGAAQRYFANLVSNGASGVMVSPLEGDESAKAVLREAAAEAELPVILLRDRVAFVDVTEAVHRVLLAVDRVEATEADPAFIFDRLSVSETDPVEILRQASELLIAPVMFEDTHHRVIAYAAAGTPPDRLLAGWQDFSRSVPGTEVHGHGEGDWLQVSYREDGEVRGRLIVPAHLADPLAPVVLERAAQVLEHCYSHIEEPDEWRFRAPVAALADLRRSKPGEEREALIRAGSVGIGPATLYAPMVLRGNAGDRSELLPHEVLRSAYLAAAESGMSVLAAKLPGGGVGGVLGLEGGEEVRVRLQRFARELNSQLSGAISEGSWVLAIGRNGAELGEACAAGLGEASEVADAAVGMDTSFAPFVTVGDVRFRRLLQSMSNDERIRRFSDDSLTELKEEGPEYVELLRAYIEHNGNIAELARAVFLSRPSVYARLHRVEEILGASLNHVDTRMGLYLALLSDSYWTARGPATT